MKKSELEALILECKEELAEEEVSQLVMEDEYYDSQKQDNIDDITEIIDWLEISVTEYEDGEIDALDIAKRLERKARDFADNLM